MEQQRGGSGVNVNVHSGRVRASNSFSIGTTTGRVNSLIAPKSLHNSNNNNNNKLRTSSNANNNNNTKNEFAFGKSSLPESIFPIGIRLNAINSSSTINDKIPEPAYKSSSSFSFSLPPYLDGQFTVTLAQRCRSRGPGWHIVNEGDPVRITSGKGKLFRIRLVANCLFVKESIRVWLDSVSNNIQNQAQTLDPLNLHRMEDIKVIDDSTQGQRSRLYELEFEVKVTKGPKIIRFLVQGTSVGGITLSGKSVSLKAHDDGKISQMNSSTNTSGIVKGESVEKRH